MADEDKQRGLTDDQHEQVLRCLNAIFKERKKKGMTQERLAGLMGMTQVGVSKYMTGETRLNNFFTMLDFSEFLQCRPEEIWPFLPDIGIGINPDDQILLQTWRLLQDSDKRYFLKNMEQSLD